MKEICEKVLSSTWQDLHMLVHCGSGEAKGILEHATECDVCSDKIRRAEEEAWASLPEEDKADLLMAGVNVPIRVRTAVFMR